MTSGRYVTTDGVAYRSSPSTVTYVRYYEPKPNLLYFPVLVLVVPVPFRYYRTYVDEPGKVRTGLPETRTRPRVPPYVPGSTCYRYRGRGTGRVTGNPGNPRPGDPGPGTRYGTGYHPG